VSQTASVVVVGAGIVGASTAYNLARLGHREVVVVDRVGVAAGGSQRSAGLVRTHYSNGPEARLALRGLEWFENWAEMVGGNPGFYRTGLINPVARADHEKLRRNVARLQEIGVETEVIGPEDLVELEPAMLLEEDDLAAYEPRSGYANPVATTRSMAEAARRAGVEFRDHVTVSGIAISGGRVSGVETSAGPISAPVVVLANGAWSVPLAAGVGIDLPIEPVAIRLAYVQRPAGLARGWGRHAVVLDRAHGAYTRPEDVDVSLVGLAAEHLVISSPDAYETDASPTLDFEELSRAQVARRFPTFAEAPFVGRHSGPIDATPDFCAIIDKVEPEGLYLAVGMSGSGFKKAPAIGEAVAEWIVYGEPRTTSVAEFRLARFAEGEPIVSETYVMEPESEAILGSDNIIH
jgi:sarcosine oxidase subunit beta